MTCVAMYKKPEDTFVDSFESEDVETTTRRLGKVGAEDLNFEALCDDSGEWPCERKERKTMFFEGRHSGACPSHLEGNYAH